MPADPSPRLLGLVAGEPATALSGVAHHLFEALDRRFSVVGRIDYAPHGWRRLGLAAATFHPRRATWRARFHTSPLAYRTLSSRLEAQVADLAADYDIAIQVHGWTGGQPLPYVPFVDQTRLMAERGWPEWLPLRPGERERMLARERAMYERASHVFVMGEPGKASLMADYGIEPGRISVVGGGVNFASMPPASGPARDPAVLFVGREFERKGGDVLLAAFERVRSRVPEALLHIVGTREVKAAPGVMVHGRIGDRDLLREIYAAARAFCLPSRYEPYGLVLTEAMALGVPCVGTRVQSIPEILDDGRAGSLVAPEDPEALAEALIALLTDDELADRLGSAGRRRVERELNWDRVAERMAPALLAIASR